MPELFGHSSYDHVICPLIQALCVKGVLMSEPKDRVVVASDVNPRDGIGVEIYRDNDLVVEI